MSTFSPNQRGLILVLFVVLHWSSARAETLRVPEQYFTIQEALDAARPGDLVQLAPGSYRQHIVLRDGVTLEGSGGRDSCRIIPPPGTDILVRGDSLAAVVVIRGITLDGKKMARQGIHVTRCRLEVVDCRVHNFNTGIWLEFCPTGLIDGNEIRDCAVQGLCIQESSPQISRNTFRYIASYAVAILGSGSFPRVGGSRGEANHFLSTKSAVDLGNGTPNNIDARYNDWGLATTVEMNSKGFPANISVIEDRLDDPFNGDVDYRSWQGQPLLQSLLSQPFKLVLPAFLALTVVIGVWIRIARGRRRAAL